MTRKINLLLLVVMMWAGGYAQSPEQNYILTRTFLKEDGSQYLDQVKYFDGLGRPVQTVQRGVTPAGKDLVTLTEYDGAGREHLHWLPKTNAGNGAFVTPDAFKNISEPLYNGDTRPYAETLYEASPLNRVLGQKAPGAAWDTHPSTVEYQTNAAGEVKYFYADGNNQLIAQAYYAPATLYKTTAKDEDGNPTTEYTDKLGRVVMQRRGANVDVYYVYNDLGQQAYVLPPLAADALGAGAYNETTDAVAKYAYVYKYDERGNCTYKKLPGCDPIYMGYDKASRLLASQDGNQRARGKITYNAYDVFGRVIYTIELPAGYSIDDINRIFKVHVPIESYNPDGQYKAGDTGYTNGWFAFGSNNFLTVNYYDDYRFMKTLPAAGIDTTKITYADKQGYSTRYPNTKGLLTATRTYLLDGSGQYTVTALYYDDKGRVVQSRSTNHLGGYDIVYNDLDFTGKPNKTYTEHTTAATAATPVTELYTYEYDHAGRLKETRYSLNAKNEILLSANTYDELGRLTTKKRHNNTDTETFGYNIRNWTTKITSGSAFEEKLYYNGGFNYIMRNRYNGNIAAIEWKRGGSKFGYSYLYDGLNRLGWGRFVPMGENPYGNNDESFSYDKHGNILTLTRGGANGSVLDDIRFKYNGNQRVSATDTGTPDYQYNTKHYQDLNNAAITPTECYYDKNGNLIADLDKSVSTIKYNLLNLPEIVQFKNGYQIVNKYDAGGQKLRTSYYTSLTSMRLPIGATAPPSNVKLQSETHYCGNKTYSTRPAVSAQSAPDNNTLQRVLHPEGYVNWNKGNYALLYYRRDHLNSVHQVAAPNASDGMTTYQDMYYYPGGLQFGISDYTGMQPYKFGGKEYNEFNGLDWYDFVARNYDVTSGMFTTPDPLAEMKPWLSPYNYCSNNFVNRVDPSGRADFWLKGKLIGNDGIDDQRILVLKTTKKSFGEGAYKTAGAGLSNKELNATKKFIKQNSGKTEAFQNNGMAYSNSIEIESSAKNRQEMVDEVSKDNGRGGTTDENNREYGGSIQSGVIVAAVPGEVANPSEDETASIMLPVGYSKFHSHPSGTRKETIAGGTRDAWFNQPPSPTDINNAGTHTNYVFSRGSEKLVYVYTSSGVQAVIPMKQFVTPRK